jgi:hypothetical protein
LTITLTDLDWETVQEYDFYQGEQQIQQVVTAVGQELTRQLLASKVTSVPTLCQAGQVWYRKADSVGHYLTLYRPITVRHPTYQQTSAGPQVIGILNDWSGTPDAIRYSLLFVAISMNLLAAWFFWLTGKTLVEDLRAKEQL